MPKGTPISLKCPSCKRGKWNELRALAGCRPTGRVEPRITRSKHQGHGNGGRGFRGHRGEVLCHDCGHKWFSSHPASGRLRCDSNEVCTHVKPGVD